MTSTSSHGPPACPRSSPGCSRGAGPASRNSAGPDQDPFPVRGGRTLGVASGGRIRVSRELSHQSYVAAEPLGWRPPRISSTAPMAAKLRSRTAADAVWAAAGRLRVLTISRPYGQQLPTAVVAAPPERCSTPAERPHRHGSVSSSRTSGRCSCRKSAPAGPRWSGPLDPSRRTTSGSARTGWPATTATPDRSASQRPVPRAGEMVPVIEHLAGCAMHLPNTRAPAL